MATAPLLDDAPEADALDAVVRWANENAGTETVASGDNHTEVIGETTGAVDVQPPATEDE